eukprot:scaffold62228_cov51-Phaeocystis_antarctica.AAC.1
MAMEVRRVIAEAHEQPILCVAYNAQRREIFTGSQDTTIKAWLSETGELLRTQREHAGWVTGLSYAYLKEARTSVLFSCSVDGRILVWQKGELLQKEKVGDKATYGVQSGPLYCLEWDARRQNLVAGANGHIWVYTVVADSINLAGQPIIKFHSLLKDAHSALQGEEPVRGEGLQPAACSLQPAACTEWLGRLSPKPHPSPLSPTIQHLHPRPRPHLHPRLAVAGARHHLYRLRQALQRGLRPLALHLGHRPPGAHEGGARQGPDQGQGQEEGGRGCGGRALRRRDARLTMEDRWARQ